MDFNVITCVIACVALALSMMVFYKGGKDTQLKIFSDYINTATNLFAKKKEFEKLDGLFDWCIMILNHLDYLAYLVNNKKIPLEYAILYKPHINNWYEKVVLGQLRDYLKNSPEKFEELKILYKRLNK